jgi:hypothetical protein
VTMKSLDEARKSFGTDEDIILVGFALRFVAYIQPCHALCASPVHTSGVLAFHIISLAGLLNRKEWNEALS